MDDVLTFTTEFTIPQYWPIWIEIKPVISNCFKMLVVNLSRENII